MFDIQSMFEGSDDSFETGRAVKTYLLPLDRIIPNENNFYPADDEGVRVMADLIEAVGLIHPLSGCQEGNTARLVSGERRYRAMKLLTETGRHYSFNGTDITGKVPLTYMKYTAGSKETLTIAAANASRDLTNEEKDRIIEKVCDAFENEVKMGKFTWPSGRKARTLSVYTGIREHYIKDYLARRNKPQENKKPQTDYDRIIRFLNTAEKKAGAARKMMKKDLTSEEKQEIRRRTAILCSALEEILTEEDS